MAQTSQHLIQIPQAVEIAASSDQNLDFTLRTQAIEYLNQVKERSEETWQACFALYIQGAGTTPTQTLGSDGKPKLPEVLRMFCLQVVDDVLGSKPWEIISQQDLQALYQALVQFVQTEYVEGSGELGAGYHRNKLCYTLALLFLRLYPDPLPTYLTPFLLFLNPTSPTSSSSSSTPPLSTTLLTLHFLTEIASEIHDPLMKSARQWSDARQVRDAGVRDSIRSSGLGEAVIRGVEVLIGRGLEVIRQQGGGEGRHGEKGEWEEVVEWGLRVLATWAPWNDIQITLTSSSLSLLQSILQHPSPKLRTLTLNVFAAFLSKGMKTPQEKMQVLNILNVMSFMGVLEEESRVRLANGGKGKERENGGYGGGQDEEGEGWEGVRIALGKVLMLLGTEALKITEEGTADQAIRATAQEMYDQTLPFLLRFLEDETEETYGSVGNLLSDTMRLFKKVKKGNETNFVLPPDKAQFITSLLEVLVNKMKWQKEEEWGVPEDDASMDGDLEALLERRKVFKTDIDSIAAIDQELFNNKIGGLVMNVFNKVREEGYGSVTWQEAELAVYLMFIFSETQKLGIGREAFFNIPVETANLLRERSRLKANAYRAKAKGEAVQEADATLLAATEAPIVDFTPFPLTPQGTMILRSVEVGMFSYPHSAVSVQYFECATRYCEFFKCRKDLIQPVLEAFVDARGVHHPEPEVRQRIFYLFAKFVKEVRNSIEITFVPAILNSIGDVLVVTAEIEEDGSGEEPLVRATTGPQPFDNQLFLFEAVGTLIGLVWKNPEQQVSLLQVVVQPLVKQINDAVNQPDFGGAGMNRLSQILLMHHLILALGSLSRGFPEAPEILPATPPAWAAVFDVAAEAILSGLTIMKRHKIIRDAARVAFSGFLGALSNRMLRHVPPLVSSMIGSMEPQELIDFLAFLGMLTHKLKGEISLIMDELFPFLVTKIDEVLALPINGTDDQVLQTEMKKSYLAFLTNIVNAGIQNIFISERNKPLLESFFQSVLALATKETDRNIQKLTMTFLIKTVPVFAMDTSLANAPGVFTTTSAIRNSPQPIQKEPKNGQANGNGSNGTEGASTQLAQTITAGPQALPGYQTLIYESFIPSCFSIIMERSFKVKDGLCQLVVHEVASLLRETLACRGMEAVEYYQTRLFPGLQCPPEAAGHLINRLRSENVRDFRKTFGEFVRDWRNMMYK